MNSVILPFGFWDFPSFWFFGIFWLQEVSRFDVHSDLFLVFIVQNFPGNLRICPMFSLFLSVIPHIQNPPRYAELPLHLNF